MAQLDSEPSKSSPFGYILKGSYLRAHKPSARREDKVQKAYSGYPLRDPAAVTTASSEGNTCVCVCVDFMTSTRTIDFNKR